MFVRDSGNTPREISRIFVRDSSGNPQEISKIYVRDSSGNPVLVFDNTTVVVGDLCPSCTVGSVYYFFVGSPSVSISNYALSTGSSYSVFPVYTTTLSTSTQTPRTQINKTYWSKISTKYEILKQNGLNQESQQTYYSTLEQNLNSSLSTDFCQWCTSNFVLNSDFCQQMGDFLLGTGGYANLTNYPMLPGYIIVDYKTNNKRSTVFSILNMPQILWTTTTHNVNYTNPDTGQVLVPFGGYDQRFAPGTLAETRSSTIYPFYDRPVLLDAPDLKPGGSGFNQNSLCGQEYCGGIFTQEFYETLSMGTCWNWGFGGTQRFFDSIIPSGPNVDPCITGDVFAPPPGGSFPASNEGGIGVNCRLFVGGSDQTGWSGINPYSWILYYESGATGKTIPEVLSDAKPQDCCTSCFYGPVESNTASTTDMCRHIYQIPPINSLTPPSTKFDFFDNIGTGAVIGVEDSGTTSTVLIRYTIPAYVKLDSSLKSKIVKMFAPNSTSNIIDQFINAGPDIFAEDSGSSLSAVELSVWRAISGFFGQNIKNGLPLEMAERVFVSSSSFYYEENRFNANPSGPSPQLNNYPGAGIGISSVTSPASLGQYPLIWWSFSGYPTEQSTHYIVLELEFSGDRCATVISNKNDALQVENLRKILKGIQFYPVQFACKNMETLSYSTGIASPSQISPVRHFEHPVYQEMVIDSTLQNGIDVVSGTAQNGCGFVDVLTSSGIIPVDQGGTGVVSITTTDVSQTRRQQTFSYDTKQLVSGVPLARFHFMFLRQPLLTFKRFLEKFYRAQTTIP